ncbi:MAG: sulfatase [Pseudomonadota bacterium]
MASQRPNIVFITSHDTGDWLNCYGHNTVNTPNLDALADSGCRVRSSFCASPVCTPSRGALMTGRYPQSNGLMGLIQTPFRWRFNDGEQHLSHLLRDAGYRTVLFNHQHEADAEDPLGFAEKRAHDQGREKLLTGERVSTAAETAEAFDAFVQENTNQDLTTPFYAQIGFFETHTPFAWNDAPPDRSKGLEIPPYVVSDEHSEAYMAALQGSIASLDAAVGTIVDSLRDADLLNDTLIVFTVDHGVELPRCKWDLYDGGIRTALLLHWPLAIEGGHLVQSPVSNVDVVPTLLDLLGVPAPDNIQGHSFAPELSGNHTTPHRDAVFAMMLGSDRWTESRCVRTERYKLIRNFSPSRMQQPPITMIGANTVLERPVVELYDLTTDPHELNNLAEDESLRATRDTLDQQLRAWMEDVDDPILAGPVPTPYYRMAMANFTADSGLD